MSLKSRAGQALQKMGKLPLLTAILYHPPLRQRLQEWPGFWRIYGRGWELLHPFDARHGTDTSGYVPSKDLPNSPLSSTRLHVYGGSQPSIVRTTLKALPPLDTFTFLDLGCGKGRPLLVASEFPFKEVIGVELSPFLAGAARANIELVRARFPGRSPARVEIGDAATFKLPPGDLVIFLYNPFGVEVMDRVVANVEKALTSQYRSLFVVYYNPVHGALFDSSPRLKRYSARTLPYALEENGYGPDHADSVVVWQGGKIWPPTKGCDARINVVKRDFRAELSP